MFALSWLGVRSCMEALRTPKRGDEAVRAIAEAGHIRPSTAYEYLRLAHRLGLVVDDASGRHALAAPVERPEELIETSTLIRLFHARRRGQPLPLRPFTPEDNPFVPFKIGEISVLRSADSLAKRLRGVGEDLPPPAAMILEMTRLWGETQHPITRMPLLSAAVASQLFERLEVSSAVLRKDRVEEFVRACMLLYGKKLVRLSIVQYATDENRPFAPFRTSLGYIKWIHTPVPYQGARDAEPVQAPRKLVSFG